MLEWVHNNSNSFVERQQSGCGLSSTAVQSSPKIVCTLYNEPDAHWVFNIFLGMSFKLGTKVTGATRDGSNIKVSVENVKDPSKKEEVGLVYFKVAQYSCVYST